MPEAMRFATFLGLVAVAIALGTLVVGRAVVVPALATHTELLDANLAKAIAGPVHLRLAEVVLAAHLVLAAFAQRLVGARWGTTVGLVLVTASAVHRFLLLPTLYEAWARADLVAGRPVARIVEAQQLELQEVVLVGTMAVLQLGVCLAVALRRPSGHSAADSEAAEHHPEKTARDHEGDPEPALGRRVDVVELALDHVG